MTGLDQKYQQLLDSLARQGGLVIAYSGGVDSTFLAFAANQALGERALSVTGVSALNPAGEVELATNIGRELRFRHKVIRFDPLANPKVATNPPDRCYHCKRSLFMRIIEVAKAEGLACVADGANLDDRGQHRPGARAVQELGVISPLQEGGFTKQEIRKLSEKLALPTWGRPSQACLASRIPYGTRLEEQLLRRVGEMETSLVKLGFEQVRLRHHGELARVELLPLDLNQIAAKRQEIIGLVKTSGYTYVCIDLEGYRFGSMDE